MINETMPRLHGVKYRRTGGPVHLKIDDYEYVGRVMRATYINGKLICGMAEIMFQIIDRKWEPYDVVNAKIDYDTPGRYFVFCETHLLERTA